MLERFVICYQKIRVYVYFMVRKVMIGLIINIDNIIINIVNNIIDIYNNLIIKI